MGIISAKVFFVRLSFTIVWMAMWAMVQPLMAQESASEPPASDSATNATSQSTSSAVTPETKVQFEPHIRQILTSHCVECHGAKQSKGGMRVDERDSLLGYLSPSDLEGSSLWTDYLTTDDPEMRMPPAKHGNPLSPLELAAIRVWIEDGADWPEGVVWPSEDVSVAPTATEPPKAEQRNAAQRVMTFIGFFHPAIVHFPIGLLLVSSLFVALGYIKRDTFEPAAFHCLWIGALGAVVSCVAGWSYAELRGYADTNDAVMRHRLCGIAVAVLSVGLTPIALVVSARPAPRLRMIWLLGTVVLALLVGIAGHQGGELTYGEDLFDRAYEQAFKK